MRDRGDLCAPVDVYRVPFLFLKIEGALQVEGELNPTEDHLSDWHVTEQAGRVGSGTDGALLTVWKAPSFMCSLSVRFFPATRISEPRQETTEEQHVGDGNSREAGQGAVRDCV